MSDLPVHDPDAEAATLAASMISREALVEARAVIPSAEAFFIDAHRRVWDACCAIDDANEVVDLTTVSAELRRTERLAQVGGNAYLAGLIDSTPAVLHVASHAAIVVDRYRQRRMVSECQRIAAEGKQSDVGNVGEWLAAAAGAVANVADSSASRETLVTAFEAVEQTWPVVTKRQAGEADAPGIPTGFRSLDRRLGGGLRRGAQYCLAGETGTGKTALGIGIAMHIAKTHGVAIASGEMPTEQLTVRAIAQLAQLDCGAIERGQLSDGEWRGAGAAAQRFADLHLTIDDRPAQSVTGIRTMARRAAAKLGRPLGLVMVDYIQIMRGDRRRGDSREQEVAEMSKGLMWLAKELDCAVLTLSQLNREAAKRDEPPRLHDLRDSGAIEQDNFGVLFVWNRDARKDESQRTGDAEIIVAKHRQGGSCGSIPVHFHGPSTRFYELAQEPDEWQDSFDHG